MLTDEDLSGWSPSRLRGRHDPQLWGSRVVMRFVQNYQRLLRRGSPAHARVHRSAETAIGACARFSRARAGSPQERAMALLRQSVLPRTRGFT